MDQLPTEILVEILRKCAQNSTQTLCTAAQLSRRLYHTYSNMHVLTAILPIVLPSHYRYAAVLLSHCEPVYTSGKDSKDNVREGELDGRCPPSKPSDQFIRAINKVLERPNVEVLKKAISVHRAVCEMVAACVADEFDGRPKSFMAKHGNAPDWYPSIYYQLLEMSYLPLNISWWDIMGIDFDYGDRWETAHVRERYRTRKGMFENFMLRLLSRYVAEEEPAAALHKIWYQAAASLYGELRDDEALLETFNIRVARYGAAEAILFGPITGDESSTVEYKPRWLKLYSLMKKKEKQCRARGILQWITQEKRNIESYFIERITDASWASTTDFGYEIPYMDEFEVFHYRVGRQHDKEELELELEAATMEFKDFC